MIIGIRCPCSARKSDMEYSSFDHSSFTPAILLTSRLHADILAVLYTRQTQSRAGWTNTCNALERSTVLDSTHAGSAQRCATQARVWLLGQDFLNDSACEQNMKRSMHGHYKVKLKFGSSSPGFTKGGLRRFFLHKNKRHKPMNFTSKFAVSGNNCAVYFRHT